MQLWSLVIGSFLVFALDAHVCLFSCIYSVVYQFGFCIVLRGGGEQSSKWQSSLVPIRNRNSCERSRGGHISLDCSLDVCGHAAVRCAENTVQFSWLLVEMNSSMFALS